MKDEIKKAEKRGGGREVKKKKITCTFHEVYLHYSGGGDTHPLPICKNCGWIIVPKGNSNSGQGTEEVGG